MIHRVMMQVSPPPAPPRGEAFGQHANDFIKLFALQISEWIRATNHLEQRVLCPFFRRDGRHDLLRENIERLLRDFEMIEFASAHGIN